MGNSFERKNPECLQLTEYDKKTLMETTSFTEDQIYDWHNGFLEWLVSF